MIGRPCDRSDEIRKTLKTEEEIIVNSKGGKQHKVEGRFDLIPAKPLEQVAIVLENGAINYGEGNWRNIDINDHINHAIAHLFKYLDGDTSEDHLTNTICRTLFASELSISNQSTRISTKDILDKIINHTDESDSGYRLNQVSLGNCLCGHQMGFHNRTGQGLDHNPYRHTTCTICGCGEYKDGENPTQASIEKRP